MLGRLFSRFWRRGSATMTKKSASPLLSFPAPPAALKNSHNTHYHALQHTWQALVDTAPAKKVSNTVVEQRRRLPQFARHRQVEIWLQGDWQTRVLKQYPNQPSKGLAIDLLALHNLWSRQPAVLQTSLYVTDTDLVACIQHFSDVTTYHRELLKTIDAQSGWRAGLQRWFAWRLLGRDDYSAYRQCIAYRHTVEQYQQTCQAWLLAQITTKLQCAAFAYRIEATDVATVLAKSYVACLPKDVRPTVLANVMKKPVGRGLTAAQFTAYINFITTHGSVHGFQIPWCHSKVSKKTHGLRTQVHTLRDAPLRMVWIALPGKSRVSLPFVVYEVLERLPKHAIPQLAIPLTTYFTAERCYQIGQLNGALYRLRLQLLQSKKTITSHDVAVADDLLQQCRAAWFAIAAPQNRFWQASRDWAPVKQAFLTRLQTQWDDIVLPAKARLTLAERYRVLIQKKHIALTELTAYLDMLAEVQATLVQKGQRVQPLLVKTQQGAWQLLQTTLTQQWQTVSWDMANTTLLAKRLIALEKLIQVRLIAQKNLPVDRQSQQRLAAMATKTQQYCETLRAFITTQALASTRIQQWDLMLHEYQADHFLSTATLPPCPSFKPLTALLKMLDKHAPQQYERMLITLQQRCPILQDQIAHNFAWLAHHANKIDPLLAGSSPIKPFEHAVVTLLRPMRLLRLLGDTTTYWTQLAATLDAYLQFVAYKTEKSPLELQTTYAHRWYEVCRRCLHAVKETEPLAQNWLDTFQQLQIQAQHGIDVAWLTQAKRFRACITQNSAMPEDTPHLAPNSADTTSILLHKRS